MRIEAVARKSVVRKVVYQHGEDASFHWILRDGSVWDPHYSLQDLSDLDDRLEAHLDGLRIAGEDGWKLSKEQL